MGQYDNWTPGFKRLYYPPVGEPWDQSGVENLIKRDDQEIMVVAQAPLAPPPDPGIFRAIDISPIGSPIFVVHRRALLASAKFSFGTGPQFVSAGMNVPWPGGSAPTDAGGRIDGLVTILDPTEYGIPDPLAFGIGAPMVLPPDSPFATQFIIWEEDSEGVLFKSAEKTVIVWIQPPP